MRRTLVTFIILTSALGQAQVGSPAGHGTIIVLDFSKDKLSIAADSRITHDNKPPDDTFCKIEVFRHRIVFTQMGSIGYDRGSTDSFPSWRNSDFARRAVAEKSSPEKDPDVELNDIASIWASSLAYRWNQAYRTSPEIVERTARPGGELLTGAVFAEAVNDAIHWIFVGVGLNPTLTPPQVQAFTAHLHDCWACGAGEKVCAMARPNIAEEFCTQSSQRAKDEAAQWSPSAELAGRVSRETLHAVRLVDDTIAFDPVGGLGGGIDSLELHNDGMIRWVFRKESCPENED